MFYKQRFDEEGVAKDGNDSTLGKYLEKVVGNVGRVCEVCDASMC